jgi:caffeoyl-CoA O-methyltransferase
MEIAETCWYSILDHLSDLVLQESNHGFFDFIFVDADKNNYLNYHKRLIKLVKVGGLIAYDNTLWNGALVASPNDELPKYIRYYMDYILDLNQTLAQDSRIQISQVPISDGITLCRRLI